jgi:hypothetical protein
VWGQIDSKIAIIIGDHGLIVDGGAAWASPGSEQAFLGRPWPDKADIFHYVAHSELPEDAPPAADLALQEAISSHRVRLVAGKRNALAAVEDEIPQKIAGRRDVVRAALIGCNLVAPVGDAVPCPVQPSTPEPGSGSQSGED